MTRIIFRESHRSDLRKRPYVAQVTQKSCPAGRRDVPSEVFGSAQRTRPPVRHPAAATASAPPISPGGALVRYPPPCEQPSTPQPLTWSGGAGLPGERPPGSLSPPVLAAPPPVLGRPAALPGQPYRRPLRPPPPGAERAQQDAAEPQGDRHQHQERECQPAEIFSHPLGVPRLPP